MAPIQDPEYECDVCGNDFEETDGVLACDEHFYCNDCAVQVFHRSMNDINEFPASCCARSRSGLPPSMFRDLLGAEFMDKYFLKLHEHYTPQAIRVYCSNAQCAAYQHPRHFDNSDHRYITVTCGCGTKTCVGCKSTWTADHVCVPTGPVSKPDWVPEYTATCRIKQCPKCKEWIQLSEACNHMSCLGCRHEFCFVCMLPFTGFHDSACPMYGDPTSGYDDEGYEKSKRGLNLYTGRDRDGYDRKGSNAHGGQGRPDSDRLIITTHNFTIAPEEYMTYVPRHLQYGYAHVENPEIGNHVLGQRLHWVGQQAEVVNPNDEMPVDRVEHHHEAQGQAQNPNNQLMEHYEEPDELDHDDDDDDEVPPLMVLDDGLATNDQVLPYEVGDAIRAPEPETQEIAIAPAPEDAELYQGLWETLVRRELAEEIIAPEDPLYDPEAGDEIEMIRRPLFDQVIGGVWDLRPTYYLFPEVILADDTDSMMADLDPSPFQRRGSDVHSSDATAFLDGLYDYAKSIAVDQARNWSFDVFADSTLGLQTMIDTEQSLHDGGRVGTDVEVSASSGLVNIPFPIDSNAYEVLDDISE